jgi:serine/threonine protein kinase
MFSFYTAQIACMFKYIHGLGIIHRDLKPENLILNHEGYMKLADFGFAKCIRDERTYSLCGTPEYTAPEVYKRSGHSFPVDWWALGVLLYEMASGFSPFHVQSDNSWDCYVEVSKFEKSYPHVRFPTGFDKHLGDLLLKLLHPNPNKRFGSRKLGATELQNHPFFKGFDFVKLEAMKLRTPFVPEINDLSPLHHANKVVNF